ncbi:MAG: M20/M25/M40 family metallo-hydrolase [Candidatus Aminicenantes bacterium]|nr:M20/M25/M40 family metallo-hydrolase [Candidatus Aminicenantes bacterium]
MNSSEGVFSITRLCSFYIRLIAIIVILLMSPQPAVSETPELDRLTSSMLAETPITRDLQQLCDEIGGRPTGSKANLESVEWALTKFKEAGVSAKKEAFAMPAYWGERSCETTISGDVSFSPRTVAMPFSAPTPAAGLSAPLVDIGLGTEADFTRVGSKAKGAFLLVETGELLDMAGLFQGFAQAAGIEKLAFSAGAAGLVYMSTRPRGLLYRYGASLGENNKHPLLIMAREQANRALRLLRAGKNLTLTAKIDVASGGQYQSFNVIGEIPGAGKPEEIVVIGAHLDAWDLGAGANDNACNVVMLIDIARQIKRLGIQPKRTLRFILWNGEEQVFIGSWEYTRAHAEEMDRHVMACSIDLGSGRILGFFTNGRQELIEPVNRALKPVTGLGPFNYIDQPIVGTDNYDFMMQGIANLVANQDPHEYAPNYHAESDTFDKIDLRQLKINGAIMAALAYGFANMEVAWKRQTRAEIQRLIDSTDLKKQMEIFHLYGGWLDGTRGRN